MNTKLLSSIIFNLIIFLVLINDSVVYPLFFLILVILSLVQWFIISRKNLLLLFLITLYILPQLFIWVAIWVPYGNNVSLWYFSIIWSYLIFSSIGDKLIGGYKFFLSIIDNKTIAGVLLGSFGAFITACICWKYLLKDNYKEDYHRIEAIICIIILIIHEVIYFKIKQVLEISDWKKTFILDNFGYYISILYSGIVYAIIKVVIPHIWNNLCSIFK